MTQVTESTQEKLVSVVIPAYNVASCVRKGLESVLRQTYDPLEIIAIDDGSTDDTVRVLNQFRDFVKVVSQPNGGLSSARNAGIRAARGEFIAFLDADDYWMPDKISNQVQLLESHPEVGFCSTATQVVSEKSEVLSEWRCPKSGYSALRTVFSRHAAVAGSGSAVLARAKLFEQVGGFDESLKALEDVDMWLRLAATSEYRCLDDLLTVVVKRSGSMSRDLEVMRRSALRVMRKNRKLLSGREGRKFWNACYASVLADYAKWEYREGHALKSIFHLFEALARAPLARGRLVSSLLYGALTGELATTRATGAGPATTAARREG